MKDLERRFNQNTKKYEMTVDRQSTANKIKRKDIYI